MGKERDQLAHDNELVQSQLRDQKNLEAQTKKAWAQASEAAEREARASAKEATMAKELDSHVRCGP